MALGVRPYKAIITGKFQDANGVWVVTVEVRDSAVIPSVRLTANIALSPMEELIDRMQVAILRAYAADLGGTSAVLDAMINNAIPIAQL